MNMNEYRLQSLVILIGQICLLSCISPDSKINENEKNVQAVVTDIPKTKVVGGRLFNYVETSYEYRDEPGQWYIFERPKGIFTYWYKEGQYDGNRIGAFKIDFYSDTILIKSIDLASLNPYTKSRYPNLSSKIFESTGDSHSNFPRPVGKVISEYARKAYT